MKKRKINKAVVLGSGTMGSQIACHFANIGLDVWLLDMPNSELSEKDKDKGLSEDDPQVRNRLVNQNLKKVTRMEPSPLYRSDYASRIQTGNFEDDMQQVKDADWILEAIVEKKDIKKKLYGQVEEHRKPGTLVSTNTSGIQINSLLEDRSDDFKAHFLGTHFFNPPRYLELLEIIPSEKTDQEIVEFMADYGDRFLGKTTVVCKDTQAFIGNRIGVYAIMLTLELMQKLDLTVEEVDTLTGKFVGRPKSATFRTADLVGLDILADVSEGIYEECPNDEEREVFKIPGFLEQLLEKGDVGEKSGKGFYQKVKDDDGNSIIKSLNIASMEYSEKEKPRFPIIEEVKKQDDTAGKLNAFAKGSKPSVGVFKKLYLKLFGEDDDKAIRFFREFYYRLFAYCSHRVPEISNDLYKIDEAIKAGFGWEFGPFEIWDILGFEDTLKHMEKAGHTPADWVQSMKMKGNGQFYQVQDGYRKYYNQRSAAYIKVPKTEDLVLLDNYRKDYLVESNDEANLIDIGDDVLLVEFTSKSNSIGMGVMEAVQRSIDLAESEDHPYRAVVIGNEGNDFSVGANLGMIAMNAFKGKEGTVEKAVESFQEMCKRMRYSSVPVVAAPHGKTLGGGVEMTMHADAAQVAAECYLGLVEFGAGLIPAGGGTTEFVRRASEAYVDDDPKAHHLQSRLMTIAQGEVAKSAEQGFEMGYLDSSKDEITLNKKRLITDAKHKALKLLEKGYQPPKRTKIEVLGTNTLSYFYTAIANMSHGHFITEYETGMARQLAEVMCGGEVTGETEVSEEYLHRLEREAFMDLVSNKKTLKRIESLLKTGKPLRN